MFDLIATIAFVLLGTILAIDAAQKWRSARRSIFGIATILSILTALSFLSDWTIGFVGLLVILILRLLARTTQKQATNR
jgi:hypothetical protein